eukprot:1159004-Pelagomonas_calceolata.AAC.1
MTATTAMLSAMTLGLGRRCHESLGQPRGCSSSSATFGLDWHLRSAAAAAAAAAARHPAWIGASGLWRMKECASVQCLFPVVGGHDTEVNYNTGEGVSSAG